jgi:hypothetical protein
MIAEEADCRFIALTSFVITIFPLTSLVILRHAFYAGRRTYALLRA